MVEQEWYDAYARIDEVAGDETSPEAYVRALERGRGRPRRGRGRGSRVRRGVGAWPDWEARESPCSASAVATYADGLDAVIAAGLRTGDPLVEGAGLLTMGPLKIISDGSLNTRTAWCCARVRRRVRLTAPPTRRPPSYAP